MTPLEIARSTLRTRNREDWEDKYLRIATPIIGVLIAGFLCFLALAR